MMVAKSDDTAGLVRISLRTKSSPTPEREVRRRKTPERKVASLGFDSGEQVTSVSSVIEISKTQRRKTPERGAAPLGHDTEELIKSTSPVTEELETKKRKTPERRSPARHLKSSEESVRKTPERRSPGRKTKKLGEEKVPAGEEESKVKRDVSPARKIAKMSASKSILTSKDEHEHEGKDGEDNIVENFTSAEKFMEKMEEPEMSPDVPIPARRRSSRLNTPDRAVAEVAGFKSLRGISQRGTTPSKQDVESRGQEVGTRQSLRRLNTPERSVVAKSAEVRPSTPTRRGRQKESPFQGQDTEDWSSSKEEKPTPSHRSSRKKQSSQRSSEVRELVEAEENPLPAELHLEHQSKKSLASKVAADEENNEQVHNLRQSRRQTKTPERLTVEVSTENTQLRKSRRQSKTPERLVEEINVESTLRKSRRQPKTPDRLIAEDHKVSAVREITRVTKTPERRKAKNLSNQEQDSEDNAAGMSETVNLRRSRRQSRTPDRQAVPEIMEPLTPTRRSRRQHKTPDVLNTDEIEPMSSNTSPKRAIKEAFLEPATPPKMSAKKEKAEDKSSPGLNQSIKSGNNSEKTAPAAVTDDSEMPLTPTRRSGRKARSPERLNTDLLQPISPHSSPTRTKPGGTDVKQIKRQSKTSQKGTTSESDKEQTTLSTEKPSTLVADVTAPAASFVFSPPLKHSLRSHDSNPGESGPQHQHHFVFSNPSVASQPEVEEKKHQQQPTKSKRKKLHKLYTEDEVLLLSPVPTPATRSSGRPRKQLSQTQRAAALFLKRVKQTPPKSRRLVPKTKSPQKN